MGIALLAFLRSPLGKWAMIAVAVAGIVVGVYAYGHRRGAQDGAESARSDQAKTDEVQYQALRKEHDAALQQFAEQREAYTARISQDDATIGQQQRTLQAQQAAALATANKIASMSDPAVWTDLVARLGRAPNDTAPTLSPVETRRLDAIAADYDSVKEQLATVQATLTTTTDKAAQLEGKVETCTAENGELTTYATNLQGLYVRAYNAIPKKRNWVLTIFTLGLAGKPRQLELPTPESVVGARTKAKT